MKATEAINKLDEMQRQVIHGSNLFGDMADVIRLQLNRAFAWAEFAKHQEVCATCAEAVSDCHQGSELKRVAEWFEKEHG